MCAAAPLVALAVAAAAVFDEPLPNEKAVSVALELLVVVAEEEVEVGATIRVVVPYADAAEQYCVWYC
jgi:hypothetical protein